MAKVLFLTIQSNISHLFPQSLNINSFIYCNDKTQSGATTPGQSGSGSDGNEGVLHISQRSQTGASPSGSLETYLGNSLGGCLTPLQRCSQCILQPPADWARKLFSTPLYIYIYIYCKWRKHIYIFSM